MKEKTENILRILIKVILGSTLCLIALGIFSFYNCGFYGQSCSEVTKVLAPPLAIILSVVLAVSLFIGYFCYILYLRASTKPIWPIILVSIVVALFLIYQNFVQPWLQLKSFKNQFASSYYTPEYIPDGYKLKSSTYKFRNTPGIYGQGSILERTYEKVAGIDGNGDEYTVELTIKMGDGQNDAMGVLRYCGKDECDVINGVNVQDIHCQKNNAEICAVKVGETYVSVDYYDGNLKPISRNESVKILDSLTIK